MVLTKDNYYSQGANSEYMSASQFKAFEACPACAMAELSGEYERPTSTALLVGSYVDAAVEGTLETFIEANRNQIMRKDGKLKAEYEQAEKMLERISKDRFFSSCLSGEKQVIMTGEIEGVKVKIKMDSYHADKLIVDLKTVRDFDTVYTPTGRKSFIEAWGYDIQGAIYQEIVRQNTGKKLPFQLAAVTKEKVPDIAVIELSQAVLDHALDHVREMIPYYDGIKRGIFEAEPCGKCDYCKSTKVLSAPVVYEGDYFEIEGEFI